LASPALVAVTLHVPADDALIIVPLTEQPALPAVAT
jgi:hypothetical protein